MENVELGENWFEEGRFYWSRNYLELCVRVHCSKLGFLVKFRTIPKSYFLNHKKRFENVQLGTRLDI